MTSATDNTAAEAMCLSPEGNTGHARAIREGLESTNGESPTEVQVYFSSDLLSASDLGAEGKYNGTDYSFRVSSSEEEELANRANEEADCEVAEYYLALDEIKKEKQQVQSQPRTQNTENTQQPVARTPATKPVKRLRRPKPETIRKLCHYTAPKNTQQAGINDENSNESHWLAENDRHHYRPPLVDRHAQSYNSTGNTDSDNWGKVTDSWYGEPLTRTCKNEHYWGNVSDYSTEHSREDNNPNCLRAGSTHVTHNPARDFYRPAEHLNRYTAIGHPRRPRRSTYPLHATNTCLATTDPNIVPSNRLYRTPERQQPTLTYGQQVRAANRRRLRIQDDYWQAAHKKRDCYTYGHYRRDHINSPNNIHTSVTYISPTQRGRVNSPSNTHSSATYISPKQRIENRINAISSELEDLRLELRALRNSDCNTDNNIGMERQTHLRW